MIDDVTLICQICIEETTENHDLIIRDCNAAQLRALLFLEVAIEEDKLPGCLLHQVWQREVESLDGAERAAVVDGTTASYGVYERLAK